jgi:hypothetical protein
MQATDEVERVGRGLHPRTEGEQVVDYDLIEIAAKAHDPTLCLPSALARHELTDAISGNTEVSPILSPDTHPQAHLCSSG